MIQASEEIARQYAAASKNYRAWKSVVYNVKDYGAEGDGVTDDSPSIQTLINKVLEDGGVIYFPEGTYLLNSTLTVAYTDETRYKPGIRFIGSGIQTTILKYMGNDYAIRIQGAPKTNRQYLGITFDSGVEDMSISGNIPGDGGTGTNGNGIYATRYHCLTLKNLFIQGFGGNGIFLDRQIFNDLVDEYSVVANITNVTVFNCKGIGYVFGSVHAVQMVNMVNCNSQENGYAIKGYFMNATFLNCYFGGNDNGGVLLTDSNAEGILENPTGINFISCGWESNGNYNLKIDSGRNINVLGGWIGCFDTPLETRGIIIGTNSSYVPDCINVTNLTINSPKTSGFVGVEIGQYSGDILRFTDVDIQVSGTSTKYLNTGGKKLTVNFGNRNDVIGTYSSQVYSLNGVDQFKGGFESNLYVFRNLINPSLGWLIGMDLTNQQVQLVNNFFNFQYSGDAELTQAGKGLILHTPDGTKKYKITVSNAGAIIATQV